MTTQHTPGPWSCSLAGTNAGKVCTVGDNEQLIATVEIGFSEEDKANARLVAAAPDLLAALRAMVATFHRTGTSEKMSAYITAQEVIAKTEGGEG